VAGFDVYGNRVELECEDFSASLMQHEIDHLDGILTLHRADPAERHRAFTELLAGATNDLLLAA
jgi:peptide deformylase